MTVEDRLIAAATQYVVLGSGPHPDPYPHLRVFEVNHQEQRTLSSFLADSGFQRGQVSFFSWRGATPYMTADTAMANLAFIGSMPAGSGVVFDYAVERSSSDSTGPLAMDALASRISSRLFMDPFSLQRMLKAAGFRTVDDIAVPPGFAHLVTAQV